MEHVISALDKVQLAALTLIAKERIYAGQLSLDLDALSPRTASSTVVGSRSPLLWDVLEGSYARLGFDTIAGARSPVPRIRTPRRRAVLFLELYDGTNLYLKAEGEDESRKIGMSK